MNMNKYFPLNNIGYIYGQYPFAGNDVEGLGQLGKRVMIDDKLLEERIEQLARDATLKTLAQGTPISGLNGDQFEALILDRTLEGLSDGNLQPVKARDFENALYRYFSTGEMAGFFDKVRGAVSKVVSKVKNVGKKIAKGVKKVIPAVVVGVATYFTGGAAVPFLKKFSAQIGEKWGTWNDTVGKFLGQKAPPPGETIENVTDPQITDVTRQIASQELAAQGINVNSPEGQAMLTQYIQFKQDEMAKKMPAKLVGQQSPFVKAPTPAAAAAAGVTDWGKILPIVLGVGAAAYMLTR